MSFWTSACVCRQHRHQGRDKRPGAAILDLGSKFLSQTASQHLFGDHTDMVFLAWKIEIKQRAPVQFTHPGLLVSLSNRLITCAPPNLGAPASLPFAFRGPQDPFCKETTRIARPTASPSMDTRRYPQGDLPLPVTEHHRPFKISWI